MQTRKSIMELAQEVQAIKDSKQDFIFAANQLKMNNTADLVLGNRYYDTGVIAHEHLGQKLQIPKPYYDRMLNAAPALLAVNVNHWLDNSRGRHMLRTVGTKARALLSDRYRPLDNDMVLEAALPVLLEHQQFEVLSTELTERRMYLAVASHRLTGEVKVGDTVMYGIVISNSEVGASSFRVEELLYRLSCMNGMISSVAMKKYHVGSRRTEEDYMILSREAMDMDNKAFSLRIRDTVANAFSELNFSVMLNKAIESAGMKVEKELDTFIADVTNRYDFSNSESDSIMKNLINGGDLSKWGLTNAVTAIANDVQDYDRAIDLQRIGGQIMNGSAKEWYAMAGRG